jgi:16S rRNA (guanine1207-N2)-methyltransferase
MSRWADDPERAADTLIARDLDAIAPQGRILLVNQGGTLPALMAARALVHQVWNRRAMDGVNAAAPWPPAGPFDTALVRLPKARDELEMTAHAVLSVLVPEGRLILYGGNDEGIRSAVGMLKNLAGAVDTIATRGHGRILAVQRPMDASKLRDTLSSWRMTSIIEIARTGRAWISYPGIFAAGRLDEGTALLLGAMPAFAPGARVLDYGCGSGVIGAAALAQESGMVLDMLDSDTVALEAARENVPGGRPVLGTRVADAGHKTYAAILSNPPLHQGVAEDHTLLDRLVTDAPSHLAPGGQLQIVVQRRLPLDRLFAEHFGSADVVAENGRFRVWRAQRA